MSEHTRFEITSLEQQRKAEKSPLTQQAYQAPQLTKLEDKSIAGNPNALFEDQTGISS